jgi:hypothetical protein
MPRLTVAAEYHPARTRRADGVVAVAIPWRARLFMRWCGMPGQKNRAMCPGWTSGMLAETEGFEPSIRLESV